MSLRKLSDGRYEMRYYQDGTKESSFVCPPKLRSQFTSGGHRMRVF